MKELTRETMNHVAEAHRYLNNAKEILREKAQKEDGYYQDMKYVKMAGHTAYTGILMALDGYLRGIRKTRKSVEWYQAALAKEDKKLLTVFNSAYHTLHLVMGYDGEQNAKIVKAGLEEAEKIISWVETKQEVHN